MLFFRLLIFSTKFFREHYQDIKQFGSRSHPDLGVQWLSGRVLDSRPKGRGLEPHPRHCVVSLSKNINPSLVLVHPRKTRPFITERLLMGRKESNQTNKHPDLRRVQRCERLHCTYLGVSGFKIYKNIVFFGLKIFFTLTNSVDPDEMPHYAAFYLGLHCLLKYLLRDFP